MPNTYREKECPNCAVKHRKRGVYCCQSCANANQTKTPEHIQKIKRSIAEYQESPEGVANAQRQSLRASAMRKDEPLPVTLEDFAVDIPDLPPELPDGYERASDW